MRRACPVRPDHAVQRRTSQGPPRRRRETRGNRECRDNTDGRGDACVAPTPCARTMRFNSEHRRVRPGGVARHGATVNAGTTPTVGPTHASALRGEVPVHWGVTRLGNAATNRRDDTRGAPAMRWRRPTRLPHFDYSQQGAYFVTICTRNRACLFGEVVDGEMQLNDVGEVAHAIWERIPTHVPLVETDAWVVMPNHVHGVIVIARSDTAVSPNTRTSPTAGATHASPLPRPSGPPKRSLGAIVGSYKAAVSRRVNVLRRSRGAPIWQRNYYEHVIRDDTALNRIRQYIVENPARWAEDPENPARSPCDG